MKKIIIFIVFILTLCTCNEDKPKTISEIQAEYQEKDEYSGNKVEEEDQISKNIEIMEDEEIIVEEDDNKQNSLIIFDVLKLSFPDEIKIEYSFQEILSGNKYSEKIEIGYHLYLKERRFYMRIYLQSNGIKKLNELLEYSQTTQENTSISVMGMGSVYNSISRYKETTKLIKTKNDLEIIKYISNWYTNWSRDILVYNFKINHDYFNECLIEFINVWDYEEGDNVDNLKCNVIEELEKINPKKVILYTILDNIINNIELSNIQFKYTNIDYEDVYYFTKFDNVELKEGQSEDSKTILVMEKGSRVKYIASGNGDNIDINTEKDVLGVWYKVKTNDNTFGYIFNYYLIDN